MLLTNNWSPIRYNMVHEVKLQHYVCILLSDGISRVEQLILLFNDKRKECSPSLPRRHMAPWRFFFLHTLAKNATHTLYSMMKPSQFIVYGALNELKNVSVMDTERLNVMSRARAPRSYFLLSKSRTPYTRLISTAMWITRPGVFYCMCALLNDSPLAILGRDAYKIVFRLSFYIQTFQTSTSAFNPCSIPRENFCLKVVLFSYCSVGAFQERHLNCFTVNKSPVTNARCHFSFYVLLFSYIAHTLDPAWIFLLITWKSWVRRKNACVCEASKNPAWVDSLGCKLHFERNHLELLSPLEWGCKTKTSCALKQ